MSLPGRRILWALIAGGVLLRLVLAWATVGIYYDIEAFQLVAEELQGSRPFALYDTLNGEVFRWVYPTGGFPFFLLADWFTVSGLLPFHALVQLPGIAADAAIAWIVQAYMGARGYSERTRLIGAGLVAFGPSFIVVSGYEGQLDTLAILPAVAALLVWERLPEGRRALAAGALIGLGGSVKTFPLVVMLALLPAVSGRREAAALIATAVAVPLLLLAPWLIAEPKATQEALRYTGIPGLGGLSLLAQPSLAESRLEQEPFDPLTGITEAIQDLRFPLLALALAAATVLLLRRRPDPALGALIVWLALDVSSVNFGPRYLVWALPFALMAGYLREAAVVQAIGAPAAFIIARNWDPEWIAPLYVALMVVLFIALLAWLVALVFRPGKPLLASET